LFAFIPASVKIIAAKMRKFQYVGYKHPDIVEDKIIISN